MHDSTEVDIWVLRGVLAVLRDYATSPPPESPHGWVRIPEIAAESGQQPEEVHRALSFLGELFLTEQYQGWYRWIWGSRLDVATADVPDPPKVPA